jgi:glycosyltransferase involved in cell wall biosynthesis
LNNEGLRAELREKGIAQAGKFTWRDAAEKTLKLYQEAYDMCHMPYFI